MDIKRRMERASDFTPSELQIARTVSALGPRLQSLTLKELALAAHVSIPSVHRFCKKLGLEGFKELKVEMAKSDARHTGERGEVDINFPFAADDTADGVLAQMASVYETTLSDTRDLLDPDSLAHAAELLDNALSIDIYTQSHNLYPAQMFCDRLLSIGRHATCFESIERQSRTALASDRTHAALLISYSGLGPISAPCCPSYRNAMCPQSLWERPAAGNSIRGSASTCTSATARACKTASRSSPATSPCNTCSIRSSAAYLPATTSRAGRFWNARFPSRACPPCAVPSSAPPNTQA